MKKSTKSKNSACLAEDTLQPIINDLETKLRSLSVSKYPFITKSVHHLLSAGGKRIRPMILLSSAGAAGLKNISSIITLSAGVELLHTATLIHDDVMDTSPMRRGKTTLHELHGNKTAILIGDFLYARAMQIFVNYGNIDIIRCISNATTLICEGETYQNLREGDMQIDEDSYLEIIAHKTGKLMEACGTIGAIAGGGSYTTVEALKNFSFKMGLIFQISDDMLDIWSNGKKMGKFEGNDILSGKITLPLIHLLNHADNSTRTAILAILSKRTRETDNLKKYLKVYRSSDYCKNLIKSFRTEALKHLQPVPESDYKDGLIKLAHEITHRKK